MDFADPAVQRHLSKRPVMVLATAAPEGTPLATPLWFTYTTSALYFYSMRTSRKVRNLVAEPRVSVVVEAGETTDAIRFAIIAGRASIVTDVDEVARSAGMLLARYGDGVRQRWGGQRLPDDRCLVRIMPTQVLSRGLV